jgi:hypothetical protein
VKRISDGERQKFVDKITALGAIGGGIAAVKSSGSAIEGGKRDELLAAVAAGQHVELELSVLAFEQTEERNRNCIRFTPAAMAHLAKTAKGMPFLRDHEQYDSLAVAGRIVSATIVQADKVSTLMEVVTISAPWAVELALRGLISAVSIGWRATGPVNCSVCKTPVFTRCWHWPGDALIEQDDGFGNKRKVRSAAGTEIVEWIYTAVELVETSIVPVPAVKAARIEEIRAAMSAALGAPEAQKEDQMIDLERIAKVLGAAAPTEEAIEARARTLSTASTELEIAKRECDSVKEKLTSTEAELAILRKENGSAKRDEFLRAAVAEGKITPGDKDLWSSLYDADQDRATKLMANRPKQSATPVGAKLQSGDPPPPPLPVPEKTADSNRPARLFGMDPEKAAAIQKELDS